MSLDYTNEIETLFRQESEKSEGMGILHQKSHKKYNLFSVLINIPVIVLSSVVGFLSTINMFPEQNYMIGALSIFIAIIKSAESYFSWTQRCESHRMVGLSYMKISKLIQIQLSLDRQHRIRAEDMLKVVQNDLQNLRDSEPIIDDDVIKDFNEQYKNENTAKPAICNGLTQVIVHQVEEKQIEEKQEEEEKPVVQKNVRAPLWKR